MNVGILGAGQLGRMLALSGRPLGLTFSFYDAPENPSASQLGTYFNSEADADALTKFIAVSDVCTYEFENFQQDIAQQVEKAKPLYPAAKSLGNSQHRGKEKAFFEHCDIPVPPYRIAQSHSEIMQAIEELTLPVVVKTTTMGYDGKGQAVVRERAEAETLWEQFQTEVIIEQFVPFKREVSQIASRNQQGDTVFYPLVENYHHEGILRYTLAPAPNTQPERTEQAQTYVGNILKHLNYVGTLTLEMFETEDGLSANEMAARVHNSGHWTQNGAYTSQFENHLRAIMGWSLGCADARGISAMINIIAEHNNPHDALKIPGTYLHLYDKTERPGRKLGHINVCAESYAELIEKIHQLARFLPAEAPILQPKVVSALKAI